MIEGSRRRVYDDCDAEIFVENSEGGVGKKNNNRIEGKEKIWMKAVGNIEIYWKDERGVDLLKLLFWQCHNLFGKPIIL